MTTPAKPQQPEQPEQHGLSNREVLDLPMDPNEAGAHTIRSLYTADI
jgi:hypothetical protein